MQAELLQWYDKKNGIYLGGLQKNLTIFGCQKLWHNKRKLMRCCHITSDL